MTQVARPKRTESGSGLAARVSLGRLLTPPSTEFVLITSAALLLTVFGLVMVVSATAAVESGTMSTAIKQGLFALVGIPLMFVVSRMPLDWLKKLAWPALILATLM